MEEDEDFEAFNLRQTVEEEHAAGGSALKNAASGGDADLERDLGDSEGGESEVDECSYGEEQDSDFEREQGDLVGSGLKRARSAKQLGQRRLTASDYARNADRKKGKYGITVPKPFGFDLREKTRHKTIRERRIEQEIAQREADE